MRLGGLQHVHEGFEIVLVVFEGFRHAFAHCLEGGEVDDGVYLVVGKKSVGCCCIAEIHLHEGEFLPEDFADAIVVGFVAVAEIVGDEYVVPCLLEFHGHVASYKSGTAGYKYGLFHIAKYLF